ncbi:FliI/YscN family ATPase [Poseidonocella sedimentorum]|uniref:Flagellum-specific ATP synthase n=1 Tax=Poseidonocella sedimentorum TaxID=871652 RepID=A0A1I6D5N8_9RHOB|nr:FliI/YscN family ATPase [Poseidonocella sedimentorum]SFR00642.1 flagellum-specific ATP synthase [Poseidonocella sedimentorum]
MAGRSLEAFSAQLASMRSSFPVGRVAAVDGGTLHVAGLSRHARVGDLLQIHLRDGSKIGGEVIRLGGATLVMLPDAAVHGVALGDRVILRPDPGIAPHEGWLGRLVDPYGVPLDGHPLLPGPVASPLRAQPPAPSRRRPLGARLETGMAIFNTMLPIVEGQRLGLFAGSGVGKSSLLATLARNMDAEVVVIALVGERGREVREFVDNVLGPEGMRRSVVVAATSDRSPLTRRRCAWTAMSVAEHFRDQGKNVLFLADSITRFAEAHREISVAAGEDASLRGYPASTAHTITSLCERAGPGEEGCGMITAIFSVLVAGSDMEEPIADILRGVLDGHVILSREIAERGRYPAIDLSKSVSRSLPMAATDEENALISAARRMLGSYEKSEMMVRSGLYNRGSDPQLDQAIEAWPRLDSFISEPEPHDTKASFARLSRVLPGK